MNNNQEKFNNWNKQIEDYQKLNLKEAQELCIKMYNTNNIDIKNEYRQEIILGLLHLVSRFIEKNQLTLINTKTIDIDDIINSCVEALIKKIDNKEILNVKVTARLFNGEFISNLNKSLDINLDNIYNTTGFEEFLDDYIKYYRLNPEMTFGDFLNHIKESRTYYYLRRLYSYRFLLRELKDRYKLFKAIIESMEEDNELNISKTRIKNIKNLIINNGNEYLNPNVDQVFITNQEDRIVESFIYDDLVDIILNNCNLRDREKIVIINRLGLLGEEPKTLKKLGEEINLSHDRVRQIESKALRRIRGNTKVRSYYKEY